MLEGVCEDLIVPLAGVDTGRMLEFWGWLIPETYRPLFATALGDLFLTAPDRSLWWLNMGDGKLETVAANEDEFRRAIVGPDNSTFWFGEGLINQLRAAGNVLGPGECYGYWQLPMLGGGYEPANFRVRGVEDHFRVWGPVHQHLRDSPDGTTVKFGVAE